MPKEKKSKSVDLHFLEGDEIVEGDTVNIDGKVFTCTKGGIWGDNCTVSPQESYPTCPYCLAVEECVPAYPSKTKMVCPKCNEQYVTSYTSITKYFFTSSKE